LLTTVLPTKVMSGFLSRPSLLELAAITKKDFYTIRGWHGLAVHHLNFRDPEFILKARGPW